MVFVLSMSLFGASAEWLCCNHTHVEKCCTRKQRFFVQVTQSLLFLGCGSSVPVTTSTARTMQLQQPANTGLRSKHTKLN